jgi:hypothetical protein
LLAAHHPILIEDEETLRTCRAIEVLERISSPEARELLDRLATGAVEATVARHAQGTREKQLRCFDRSYGRQTVGDCPSTVWRR